MGFTIQSLEQLRHLNFTKIMPKRKNTQNSAQSNGPTRKNKNKKDENFETEKSHFKTLCQWMVDHIFPILENVKVSKNSEKLLDHLLNVTSEDFMEDKLVDFLFYGDSQFNHSNN